MMSIDDQLAALSRRAERIVPEADLRAKLERSAKTHTPLRIKFGMDPTAPDITLGHAVPLKIIRQFQDWVMIEAEVGRGGSNQPFNNPVGRDLQGDGEKPGQGVIVTPLLVGTDGVKKMSKSQKNYIAVTDPPSGPSGMFGKIMSLPDALMESYYTLLTDLPIGPVKEQIQRSPRDAKIGLAKHVIGWLHDAEYANIAEADVVTQFVKHEAPTEMPEVGVSDLGPGPHKLTALLVRAGLAASNGEGTRKIKEGAVSVDGEQVTDFQKFLTIDKATAFKLVRKYARLLP